jgi:hypothetical protein
VEPDQRHTQNAADLGEALARRHPLRIDGVGAGEACVHEMETVRKQVLMAGR